MEEKKINNSANIGRVFLLVVSLIVIGVSGSYAYFTTNIQGAPTTTTVSSGQFEITSSLESASAIKDTNLQLINESDIATKAKSVSFNVVSAATSTINAKYDIYLKNITLSKNLYSSDFKWQLLNSDSNKIIAQGDFSSVVRSGAEVAGEANNVSTTANDIKLTEVLVDGATINDVSITPSTTQNLTFRIWLQNDASRNQIGLTDGRFEGKLAISAVPANLAQ